MVRDVGPRETAVKIRSYSVLETGSHYWHSGGWTVPSLGDLVEKKSKVVWARYGRRWISLRSGGSKWRSWTHASNPVGGSWFLLSLKWGRALAVTSLIEFGLKFWPRKVNGFRVEMGHLGILIQKVPAAQRRYDQHSFLACDCLGCDNSVKESVKGPFIVDIIRIR